MRYEKPELTVMGTAIQAVQATSKTGCELDSGQPGQHPETCNAYEADE
jgi:hypothetical protein